MAHEIDFLAVGDGERSGDAIALRYGNGDTYAIHVIDGGDLDAGERMVEHIRTYYGDPGYIDAVVCTHGDDDHSSGLRRVIEGFDVGGIWMNRPWLYVWEIVHLFDDGRLTPESLERRLREAYPILDEIERMAAERGIPVHEAFQGTNVGAFTILAPSRERYLELIPQFSRTPEQAGAAAAGGLRVSGVLAHAAQAVRAVAEWIAEEWGIETLEEEVETSASNESSVVQLAALDGSRVLLTGDAGVVSLHEAADYAELIGYQLPGVRFVQVPHHGSRHNVNPSSLNRWVGDPVGQGETRGTAAHASVGKESKSHPRKKVVNSFIRRGANVYSTKGQSLRHHHDMPPRQGWSPVKPHEFSSIVEG